MATPGDDFSRTTHQLVVAAVDAATRLAVLLLQHRAERLRLAAIHSEQRARLERAQLQRHHRRDKAVWQQAHQEAFWATATPQQVADVWQAAWMWHLVDPHAAEAKDAITLRLQQRGVDLGIPSATNRSDARWLHTALTLATQEREQAAALAAERDSDLPTAAAENMWQPDETTPPHSDAFVDSHQHAAAAAIADDQRAPRIMPAATDRPGLADPPLAASPRPRHRLQEMPDVARQLWPADQAQRLLADPAWPTLAKSLHHLHTRGHDLANMVAKLPYNTTDTKSPAILTEWTLRQVAAGPIAARQAGTQRQRHLTRIAAAANPAPEQRPTQSAPGTPAVDPGSATRLAAAFPPSANTTHPRTTHDHTHSRDQRPAYVRHHGSDGVAPDK